MQQCAHRSISDEGVAGAPAQAGVSPATTGGTNQTTTAAVTAGVPHQRIDFVYDWQGRRGARHVYSSANGSTWTFQSGRRFLYVGWNPIAEYTAASAAPGAALTASHTWGIDVSGTAQGAGGVGGLLASTLHDGASSQTFLPSFEGNGNISALSDPGGALLTRTDYSPFGQVVARYRLGPPGDTRPDRLTFGISNKYTDAESGLLYYGYRYLDPVAGRWLSRDPIGENGGVNLYGFVGNDGVGCVDFLGLDACDCGSLETQALPLGFCSPLRTVESHALRYGVWFALKSEGMVNTVLATPRYQGKFPSSSCEDIFISIKPSGQPGDEDCLDSIPNGPRTDFGKILPYSQKTKNNELVNIDGNYRLADNIFYVF